MLHFADIKPVVLIISPEIYNRLMPTKNVTGSEICHQLSFAKWMTFYLQSVFVAVYLCLLGLVLTQECDKTKTYNWHLYSSKCFSTVDCGASANIAIPVWMLGCHTHAQQAAAHGELGSLPTEPGFVSCKPSEGMGRKLQAHIKWSWSS